MEKKTKIVATIGPATESEEMMTRLIEAGMNVARFNTKHADPSWHLERIHRLRAVAARLSAPIGILLDLQGPEVRLTIPGGAPLTLEAGQDFILTSQAESQDPQKPIIPQLVLDSLALGNHLMADDGLGEFVVTAKDQTEVTVIASNRFTLANRKTLNTPGVTLATPSLIEQDLRFLDALEPGLVDFVALSYVRDQTDIAVLRAELVARQLEAAIVAKIENQASLDHLTDIIEAADAIMIARGDLAVEVPFPELAYWQKQIIERSRQLGKPVITATQMLKSMVEQARPTRAEVTDVANAIYDGTDAVMLSEETTVGRFPLEAVETQAAIASFNEKQVHYADLEARCEGLASYVTQAAVALLKPVAHPPIAKIICLTESGATARQLARFRPALPLIALTSQVSTYHQLSLVYGVSPYIIELAPDDQLESSHALIQKILYLGLASPGETILLIHGTFWKRPGLTNALAVVEIP